MSDEDRGGRGWVVGVAVVFAAALLVGGGALLQRERARRSHAARLAELVPIVRRAQEESAAALRAKYGTEAISGGAACATGASFELLATVRARASPDTAEQTLVSVNVTLRPPRFPGVTPEIVIYSRPSEEDPVFIDRLRAALDERGWPYETVLVFE
jgi:hypothetical protein